MSEAIEALAEAWASLDGNLEEFHAGHLLTLQRKRTGGNQHVTVKHIHQQVRPTDSK